MTTFNFISKYEGDDLVLKSYQINIPFRYIEDGNSHLLYLMNYTNKQKCLLTPNERHFGYWRNMSS